MAKLKNRTYGINPPYIDLEKASDVARQIYEQAGGSASEDALSRIFGNSIGSSSFRRKVLAMKAFGLVIQASPGDRVLLSETGRSIAGATSPEQRAEAMKTAFLKIENHKILYEQFAGKLLPTGEFFFNAIREHCKVPTDLVLHWKDSFIRSANVAGLLQERPDGKVQLRRDPGFTSAPGEESDMATEEPEEAPRLARPVITAARPPQRQDVERFQIPLPGEGRVGAVEMPKGWTESDVRKMIHVIQAMFLWGEGDEKK